MVFATFQAFVVDYFFLFLGGLSTLCFQFSAHYQSKSFSITLFHVYFFFCFVHELFGLAICGATSFLFRFRRCYLCNVNLFWCASAYFSAYCCGDPVLSFECCRVSMFSYRSRGHITPPPGRHFESISVSHFVTFFSILSHLIFSLFHCFHWAAPFALLITF